MTTERYYVTKDGKRMRCGYSTGSCAAAAAKAAAMVLFGGKKVKAVCLRTIKGMEFTIPVEEILFAENTVKCAVRKDAGDDPDITNGILVYAQVSRYSAGGFAITIDGGEGVGRVTKPGLDQPVGAAAINRGPRQMIQEELQAVAKEWGYNEGLQVIISIPDGERLAKKTFNSRLGIVGGLSVLGTTGVVEPMSDAAVVDTVRAEFNMLRAAKRKYALITPGNYGEEYLKKWYGANVFIRDESIVKVSNFIGDALDIAVESGFEGLLLAGHIGKLVKLAGGLMNTHSRHGDCRAEIIAAHAGMLGADTATIKNIMDSVTTEHMLDVLEGAGQKEKVMKSILEKIAFCVDSRVQGAIQTEILIFSNQHGFLAATEGAGMLVEKIAKDGF